MSRIQINRNLKKKQNF